MAQDHPVLIAVAQDVQVIDQGPKEEIEAMKGILEIREEEKNTPQIQAQGLKMTKMVRMLPKTRHMNFTRRKSVNVRWK